MDREHPTYSLLGIALIVAAVLAIPGVARAGGVLQTEPAELMPYGKAELQVGSVFSSLEDGDELWVIPSTRLRLGLGGVSEFFVNLQTARRHSETGGMEGTGLRLFDIGTKFALDGRGPGETARGENLYSFYFRAKVPSADKNKGLGEDKTDLFGRFLTSGDLGKARYDLNLGVGILQKAAESSGQDDILTWGAALDYPVGSDTGLLLEASGRTDSTRHPGETLVTAGLRFGNRFDDNFQIGVRRGLGNSDEEWAALASYQLPLGLFGGDRADGGAEEGGDEPTGPETDYGLSGQELDSVDSYLAVNHASEKVAEELEVKPEAVELLLGVWSESHEELPCYDDSALEALTELEFTIMRKEGLLRFDGPEDCTALSDTAERALEILGDELGSE